MLIYLQFQTAVNNMTDDHNSNSEKLDPNLPPGSYKFLRDLANECGKTMEEVLTMGLSLYNIPSGNPLLNKGEEIIRNIIDGNETDEL
jgi:hypothetical protein